MPKFRSLLASRSIQKSEVAITAEAVLDYLHRSTEPIVDSSAPHGIRIAPLAESSWMDKQHGDKKEFATEMTGDDCKIHIDVASNESAERNELTGRTKRWSLREFERLTL